VPRLEGANFLTRAHYQGMGHPRPHNRARLLGNPQLSPYYCDWGHVVGSRMRRLREARGMTLRDLAAAVMTAERRSHSIGYLSHLERGMSSAPFFTYVAIAEALGELPGRVFGPDPVGPEPDGAERMLVHCLRGLGIKPEDAMLRLLGRPLDADQQLTALDGDRIPGGAVVGD
jgi:transcriptional regulator with XRE-family HTH domain